MELFPTRGNEHLLEAVLGEWEGLAANEPHHSGFWRPCPWRGLLSLDLSNI